MSAPATVAASFRSLFTFVLLSTLLTLSNHPARGQGAGLGPSIGREPTGMSYPSPQYYTALEIYRSGELDRAIDAFEFAISRSRKDINGHWLDAIPAYAMMGECQYQLGDLESAMANFDMSLKIAIRYRGWLARPVWSEVLMANFKLSPKQYLWPEANAVNRLPLTRSVKYYSGEQLTEAKLAQGGRIEELNIKPLDVIEVLRGLAIASYRRRIILGPLADGDSLATQAIDATRFPSSVQLPLARSLIGSMRCCEKFGATQDERALEDASKYGTYNNGVHPISPLAGLCAASALAGTEKPAAAIPLCMTVANQAASMDYFEWVGEALQLAAGCASENEAAAVQQMAQVAAAKLLRKSRFAALHCLVSAADAAVTAGDLNSASQRLGEAQSLAMRRDVIQPRLVAYIAYVKARVAVRTAEQGNSSTTPAWEEPMTQIINFATKNRLRKRELISMPRLYQLQRVRLALGRTNDVTSADQLLALYSADPTIDVWRRDPVDALVGTMADRELLRLGRLRSAASREAAQDVFARIEDIQSGRVRSQLALGGRVMQVRSLSRLPDSLLDTKVVQQRNVAAKPFRDLRSATLAAMDAKPLPDADPALVQNKIDRLNASAWKIALDRYAIPVAMPRELDARQPTAAIPDGVAILAYYADGNVLHSVLCTKRKSTYWSIKGSSRISAEIGKLMREVGASQKRGGRLPEDESWREDAMKVRDRLFDSSTGTLLEGPLADVKHLIIIPDSLLWYLPFEILPTEDETSELLGDKIKLSYAATPSLALFPTGEKTSNGKVALAGGRFFAPRDLDANKLLMDSIFDSLPEGGGVRLPEQAKIPTCRSGEVAGHLIVAEPTTPTAGNVLDTPVASYEAASKMGRIRAWLGYPPTSPQSVFLAGFRSNLDTSQGESGLEIMQSIAALQYSGVRDVIISRWAVGGESTAILLREYAQELPFIGAKEAFARSVNLLRRSEISPAGEPTLGAADQERETLTGDEPFFWSGYLQASPLLD